MFYKVDFLQLVDETSVIHRVPVSGQCDQIEACRLLQNHIFAVEKERADLTQEAVHLNLVCNNLSVWALCSCILLSWWRGFKITVKHCTTHFRQQCKWIFFFFCVKQCGRWMGKWLHWSSNCTLCSFALAGRRGAASLMVGLHHRKAVAVIFIFSHRRHLQKDAPHTLTITAVSSMFLSHLPHVVTGI